MKRERIGAKTAGQSPKAVARSAPRAKPAVGKTTTKTTQDQEKRELLQWPYTIHAIDDTLDAELIEGRGKQMLFQALNQKSAVAFVGSGLPLAFGRLSWADWQKRQFGLVREVADAFIGCADASHKLITVIIELLEPFDRAFDKLDPNSSIRLTPTTTRGRNANHMELNPSDTKLLLRFFRLKKSEVRFRHQEVEKLLRTLKALSKEGPFLGGEGPPIVFQVAAKLQDVLTRSQDVFIDRDRHGSGADSSRLSRTPPLAHRPVEEGAWLGFREASKVSPAPSELIAKIGDLAKSIPDTIGETSIDHFSNWNIGIIRGSVSNPAFVSETERKLADFLEAFLNYRKALRLYDDVLSEPAAGLALPDMAKALLIDECAHAEQILSNAVEYSPKAGRLPWREVIGPPPPKGSTTRNPGRERLTAIDTELRGMKTTASRDNLRRDIRGIRDLPERYQSLAYFKTDAFLRLLKVCEGTFARDPRDGWCRILELLTSQLNDNNANVTGPRLEVGRTFVSPTHRFVFEMLMARFEHPYNDLELSTVEVPPSDPTVMCADNTPRPFVATRVEPGDFQSRRSIIDADLDPLESVSMRLGISRFLTTNYDLEIERFYQDRGYRRFTDERAHGPTGGAAGVRQRDQVSYRVDGVGGVFKDHTFRREHASDLVAFAVDEQSADAHVFHLHGRATKDDDIVATERDYMDLYLLHDHLRESVDESIRIGFAANPLVFIGLGMSEADLLRPLRQFMSNRDRAVNRTAIALLPGKGSREAQAKEAATIYLRYGTHTIHFGWAEVTFNYKDEVPRSVGLDWLQHALDLVWNLKTINERMRDALVLAVKLLCNEKLDSTDVALHELLRKNTASGGVDETHELLLSPDERLRRIVKALGRSEPRWAPPNSSPPDTIDPLAFLLGSSEATGCASELEGHFTKEGTPGLALPRFRSRADLREDEPREDERAPHPLQFECGLLGQLLRLSVANELATSIGLVECLISGSPVVPFRVSDLRHDIREVNARIAGLEGLSNAIMTGALCASLKSLEGEWQAWWRNWQLSPPHRVARFEAQDAVHKRGKVFLPRRYARHRLANVITDMSTIDWPPADPAAIAHLLPASGTDIRKTGSQTRVRSFETFLDAVQTRMETDQSVGGWDRGRRWFCIAAPRGTGRGAFLSAFQTACGLGEYVAASWPKATDAADPLYVSAVFINLSFSTEVASIFDMLVEALLDTIATVESVGEWWGGKGLPVDLDQLREAVASPINWEDAASGSDFEGTARRKRRALHGEVEPLSRMRRLEHLLVRFRKAAQDVEAIRRRWWARVSPRLLICVSGIEMLHHAGGLPKNREVEEFLSLLTRPDLRDSPYDLVFITSEENLGEVLVREPRFLRKYLSVMERFEPDLPTVIREGLGRKDTVFVPIVRQHIDGEGLQNVEHRLRRSRMVDPVDVQALLGLTGGQPAPLPRGRRPRDACYVHFARVLKPERLMVDNFLPLAAILHLDAHCDPLANEGSPGVSAEVLRHFRIPSKPRGQEATKKAKLLEEVEEETSSLWKAWRHDTAADCHREHGELRTRRQKRVETILGKALRCEPQEIRSKLEDEYKAKQDTPSEWRQIRSVLSGCRYCLTILLAAAQRHALNGRDVKDGARRAMEFIRKTVDHVKAVSVSRREEAVLHDVLDAYEAFHVIGEPHNDIELHLIILRHLAVIGGPCSADVLVRVPQVLDYFDRLPEDRERSRNLRLTQALTVLAERGLIFRMHPHPRLASLHAEVGTDTHIHFEQGEAPKHAYRYALHRLMQRHILLKMGAGPREFAEINNLAPSLYASMPADLPRLNHEAYRFLRELVDSLSQYPDRGASEPAGQRWHFGEAPHTTRVQALRCALSLVRSTFSVAVVSRFEEYKGLGQDVEHSPRGYFEAYRVQVRWLIRKAMELYRLLPREAPFDSSQYRPSDEKPAQLRAFYRDEIVWLYNECGVICLVQGNLLEAAALLRQAIHFNREIEGSRDGGAQYNRLSLNLAITQIERGRLDSATTRLRSICDSERQLASRPGRVWHIAHGYLGLVMHLRGDLDEAARHYERAIEVLRVYDDLRACSIFSKHFGDLERLRDAPDRARRHIDNAIGFAQAGGHEDLHKRARLSQILLEINRRQQGDFSLHTTLAQLRLIEDYAETMEMPSLLCDVSMARARLLLEHGESTLAGSLLARAMSLAKRNGMILRLNSSITAYARVLAMRNLRDQANHMLFTALDMAKRNNNQIEIARVETAFDDLHQVVGHHAGRAARPSRQMD